MRNLFLALLIMGLSLPVFGQSLDELRNTARDFQRQGDYENAIMVLNKAREQSPNNPEVLKDLSMAYYVSRKYDDALRYLKPLLDAPDADEQVYQMGGLIYRTKGDLKEADKAYKAGLKKYPASGILYADYGEMLEHRDPGQGKGIDQWLKGLEADAQYSGNYYHAAKYYYNNNNYIRALVLGEIFANLESYSPRTAEIKNIILDAVKKLYLYNTTPDKGKSAFESAIIATLGKSSALSANGITAESLSAIRTRFILDWQDANEKSYPFSLFDMHTALLKDGLFDAYNQWLFGSSANMALYQSWTKTHQADYTAFTNYQRNRLFKVGANQNYFK